MQGVIGHAEVQSAECVAFPRPFAVGGVAPQSSPVQLYGDNGMNAFVRVNGNPDVSFISGISKDAGVLAALVRAIIDIELVRLQTDAPEGKCFRGTYRLATTQQK